MVERKRGCGYRKVGGLYLCGEGIPVECDRLPYELTVCRVCGAGVKQCRGFTWIDWEQFAGRHILPKQEVRPRLCFGILGGLSIESPTLFCNCLGLTETTDSPCPICNPPKGELYGLLWVGKRYYTPESFVQEAIEMGVSKRIAHIPNNLVLGKTRIVFAHPEAVELKKEVDGEEQIVKKPGIFYSFVPKRVEQIVTKEQDGDDEFMEQLKQRGITPVFYEGIEEEKE